MPKTEGPPDEAVVVTKAYDLALWIVQKVENLPRSFRYTIGERLSQNSMELLLTLVEAAYTRDKAGVAGQSQPGGELPEVSLAHGEGPEVAAHGCVRVRGRASGERDGQRHG